MLRRILITISYDGALFCGWQRQKDETIRTVQLCFEKGCEELFKQPVECTGASRTDKGVHSFGQRATIYVDTTIPSKRLPIALNCFLPDDIAVIAAEDVGEDFHPRYSAKKKTYEYKILNDTYRNPVLRNYSEFIYEKLDIIKMQEAAYSFLGTHDFKAFCATGSSVKTSVRTIFDISVYKSDKFIIMNITGDGFLYNMIRIIAGTLIYVGLGKIDSKSIPDIINSKNRQCAGKTAGAQGLTLLNIEY